MATETVADTRPEIGTIGRVRNPAKGDWGRDYIVTDHTTRTRGEREFDTIQVDSVARLVTHHAGSLDGKVQPWTEVHEDKPAERAKHVNPAWFTPSAKDEPETRDVKDSKPHASVKATGTHSPPTVSHAPPHAHGK